MKLVAAVYYFRMGCSRASDQSVRVEPKGSFQPPLRTRHTPCVACVNSMFIILQSLSRNSHTPDFYEQKVSECIVLLILPVPNDVLEYFN